MSDSNNCRTVPTDTPTSTFALSDTAPLHESVSHASNTGPTIHQDIGCVLLSLVDAMNDVQTGLTAFMNVAADNGSEFANTAHWMVGRIDAEFDNALSLAKAAHGAHRAASFIAPMDEADADVKAVVERLRAFAARDDDRMPYIATQESIDGAVADAIFVLAKAQRWGQFEPIMKGLARAGIFAAGGAA